MTPKERAAMQLALKAMEDASPYGLTFKEASAACGEVLAEQAEQEPVAWGWATADGEIVDCICPDQHDITEGYYTIPLYTQPVRTKDLTDDEIEEIVERLEVFIEPLDKMWLDPIKFTHAVIEKFKEKNK